jgi:radical SAM protein with 4Fe4S-binding SPASM domain
MAVRTEGAYTLYSCLWELTLRCNMRCMHCGSVAGTPRDRELSLDEAFRVADELVAMGCGELTFIGGEVFLYPGWEKIGRHLSDRGLLVNIMSNGYRFDQRTIEQIQYARLTNVGISVDGLEANHTAIRGRADAFTEALTAFGLLNAAGVSIGVVTSLMEMNYPDLEALYTLFLDHKVQLWQLQLVNAMGNMADKRDLLIRRDKIPLLTEFVREKNKERRMLVVASDNIGYYDDNESRIRGNRSPICCWEGCQAGISSLYIDSVGNVKGCGAMYAEDFIEGNVRTRALADIWSDANTFSYNRRFSTDLLDGDCRGCDVGDVCKGGCRASNFFFSGSLYKNALCSRVTSCAVSSAP